MFLRIFILTIILIGVSLNAKKLGDSQRIIISQIAKDEYRMRIYLNHENPYETQRELVGPINNLVYNLPTPDRFEITGMRKFLIYKTGLSVSPKNSYILEMVNNQIVFQSPLITELGAGTLETIQYEIPIDKIYDGYNSYKTNLIQNGIVDKSGSGPVIPKEQKNPQASHICKPIAGQGTSGGGGAKVWTQVYTEYSYIEYDFKLKPFEEKLKSIYRYFIDNKNLINARINLVFPESPTENDINNYGLLTNILGYLLKFRDIKFSVSTTIDNRFNNIVIMKRDSATELMSDFVEENNVSFAGYEEYAKFLKDFDFSYDDQIAGNLNVIQNPIENSKGILVITGDSQSDIESAIFKLADKSLKNNQEQQLIVKNIVRPPKAKPFTSPRFVPFGQNIIFSDETLIKPSKCSDAYISTFKADFQMYPIIASKKDLINKYIDMNINYFTINSPNIIFMFNIYINNVLTQQFVQRDKLKSISGVTQENGFINLSLLKEGMNRIDVEIVKYPIKESVNFGLEDIKTKILDISSFQIPKILPKVKYPNLSYISQMAFPFSIYPDLQNTGILITDFSAETIASAMQISFQLGKQVNYPAYYLTTTYNINSVLDKDIIVVGPQIKEYAPLYQNAPVKFTDYGIIKEQYMKEYDTTRKIEEHRDFSHFIIAQTYRSIFNPKRIIFEISSTNSSTLLTGVQDGLNPNNIGQFFGDAWIYDVNKKHSQSYRLKKPYLLEDIVDGYKIDFSQPIYQDIKEF